MILNPINSNRHRQHSQQSKKNNMGGSMSEISDKKFQLRPEPLEVKANNPPLDDSEQLDLIPLESLAYDEMNIIENPIALLSKDTSAYQAIPLSADGERRLVCSDDKLSLPNSFAPRVVLGLMWLSKRQNDLKSPVIRVGLRDLVTNYIHPNRKYAPSRDLLRSTEYQINCVAASRIITDNWFDKKLGRATRMNAAIIDYVQVIDEGGKNRPRVLEIRWGEKFWKSMQAQYTKGIDVSLLQRISKPLDLALYRLLDRQLHSKSSQFYSDIIVFAQTKLAMTGQKIDAGGRTASSYIARQLKDSIQRLSLEGFRVRMILDQSTAVFSVRFERLEEEGPNEVVAVDPAGDLIREFLFVAHKIPKNSKRQRLQKADRQLAEHWLEQYGFEKAQWMVKRSVQIQEENKRQRILAFRGLAIYEGAAAGDFEVAAEKKSGQMNLFTQKLREQKWDEYKAVMLAKADKSLSQKTQEKLQESAKESTKGLSKLPQFVQDKSLEAHLSLLKLQHLDAMTEEEFFNYDSLSELKQALTKRHGVDFFDQD